MVTNMRLSQLARKLNVSQSEINGLLKRRGISHKGGGNTKMNEDHVTLVIEYFMPELLEKNEVAGENTTVDGEYEIHEEQEIKEDLEEKEEELILEAHEEEKSISETDSDDDIVEVEEIEVLADNQGYMLMKGLNKTNAEIGYRSCLQY